MGRVSQKLTERMIAPRLAGKDMTSLHRFLAFATSTRGYVLLVGLYLALHAAVALLASPNIGTDEVDQALAAQSWAWGYEPRNPPLYTWLMMAAYAVFGVGVVAHVVVKYVLLSVLYALAYAIARRLLRTPGFAELCALSLTFMQITGYNFHVGFSHTLILSVGVLGTLWAFLRVVQERRAIDYALLGAALAFGLLSKYNFALFAGPLLAAALLTRGPRAALLDWRSLLTLAVSALLVTPHVLWLMQITYDYASTVADVTGVDEPGGYLSRVAAGLGNLALSALRDTAPLWIAALALFRKSEKSGESAGADLRRLLWLCLTISAALPIVYVFFAGAGEIKWRYLAPVYLQAPFALFAWLDTRTISAARLRVYAVAAAVFAVTTIGIAAARGFAYGDHCRRCWMEMPIDALAVEMREAGFRDGTIIAGEWHVAGNLRLMFPEAAVLTPGFVETSPPRDAGQCVLAWNARLMGDPLPETLAAYARERLGGEPAGAPIYVDAPLRRSNGRPDRLAFQIVANANGGCRAT